MTDIDCFVIASGPSLVGFDFLKLPSAYRIGANKSGWLAGCDTMVTIDRHFPRKCRQEIAAFTGEKVFAVDPIEQFADGITYVRRERGEGFSESPFALRGYDSGFAALNLAYLRGYKRIGLLGFDFKWIGGKTHFHNGYAAQGSKTEQDLARWASAFNMIGHKVDAINFVGEEGSNVTAFPTRPLEEAYGCNRRA